MRCRKAKQIFPKVGLAYFWPLYLIYSFTSDPVLFIMAAILFRSGYNEMTKANVNGPQKCLNIILCVCIQNKR